RTRCGSSWKSPRGSVPRHGPPAPGGRFFRSACGAAGGADDRAVNAPELLVHTVRITMRSLEPIQHTGQRAVGVPAIEVVPDRGPVAQLLGQITPRSAGAQNPEDAVHHIAWIAWRTAGGGGLGKEILNAFPLII